MSVLLWVIHRQVLGLSQCTFFLDAGCYTCVQQQAQGQGCVDDSENEESFGNVLIHNAQLDELCVSFRAGYKVPIPYFSI